jgi:hypothetical protein
MMPHEAIGGMGMGMGMSMGMGMGGMAGIASC